MMDETEPTNSRFAYTTGWNDKLRKPLLGEVWLSEAESRDRFENQHIYFQVLEAVALQGKRPAFLLEIRSSDVGWIAVNLYNSAGSIVVSADLRPEGNRYFCTRVASWTYPDTTTWYRMDDATSITTVTFEPDGTGTLTVRDKLDPVNDVRMEARDIPVAEHWVDRFEFGEWDVLLNLPMLKPTRK